MSNTKEHSRIIEFDYIRSISIIGILVCHSCFLFSAPVSAVGRYFAMTFNFLFLALSAFLFGLSWENKNRPVYGITFFWKRIVKLSKSYYPYLITLFLFLYFAEGYFSWRKVLTHTLYLPWFDKIDGFGHLWFLTMIVICYAGIWIYTLSPKKSIHNTLLFSVLTGGGICADFFISSKGLPGYLFPYLIAYILIFSKARVILGKIRKVSSIVNVCQLVIINTIAIAIFIDGIFDKAPFWAYLIGMICAGSVFSFSYNLLKKCSSSKLIAWFSGISFEIYLVHEFFIGKFNIYDYIPNVFFGFVALVILSTIAAYIIHRISPCFHNLYKVLRSFLSFG